MADQNAIQENERESTNSTRKFGGWARLCIVLTALWWALVGAFVWSLPNVTDEGFILIVVIAFAPPIVLLMFGWVVRGFVKHGL